MASPYLSVIIPAHNEAGRIHGCLSRWTSYLWHETHWPFELIVVCNGCSDNTQAVLQFWREEWPQIQVLDLPEPGKGGAVRAGMLAAHGRYRYMADVDLSTPPGEVAHFIDQAIAGADVVIGSRCKRSLVKQSPRRALAGRVFHLLTATVVPGIQDTQCGFKLFTAEAAQRLFRDLTIAGWAFDVEILADAQRLGYRVHELPVRWEEGTESRVRLVRDSLRMAADIIELRGGLRRLAKGTRLQAGG